MLLWSCSFERRLEQLNVAEILLRPHSYHPALRAFLMSSVGLDTT